MTIRGAFLDRVLIRIDTPVYVKQHWRDRVRADDPHAVLITALVKPGDTTVDVGANWGLYTIGLSELVGPLGRVLAFEPGPALDRLRKACARRSNVTVYGLALSERAGTATLVVPHAPGTSADALARLGVPGTDTAGVFEVVTTRLDDLDLAGHSNLTLIKCDVEGHEDAVLRGAETTVRANRPALMVEIEERHRNRPVTEAFELLASWDYDGYVVSGRGLRPLAAFDIDRDQRSHLVDGRLPLHVPAGYLNDFLFLPKGTAPPQLVKEETATVATSG